MKKKSQGLTLLLMCFLMPLVAQDEIYLYPYSDQEVVDIGEQYCVEIKVDNFVEIIGFQFSVNWDTSSIRFDSVFQLLPGLENNGIATPPAVDNGNITTSWVFSNETPVTLVDGSNLFEACFTVLPEALPENIVQISGVPTLIEFVNFDEEELDVVPGSTSFSLPGETMGLSMWPGDTDESEAVNHYDLLNIGLGFGETGPVRTDATLDWQEQEAMEWDYSTPNSTINGAHLDTDGNGTVNAEDVLAIDQNWGETTNFWEEGDENRNPSFPVTETLADPALMLESQTVTPGENATFNILFGDETTPAEDIYGLAFTIVYDPAAVVGGSLSTSFADSWLGDENNELITIYRERAEDNRIDVALSRINQENQSGFGAIAQLNLTIAELIQEENYAMAFDIENVRIINAGEELIPAVQPTTYSEILGTTDTHAPELANQVSIFPVPARDFLQIRTSGLTVETTSLYSIDGKFIQRWNGNPQEIATVELEAGTYVVKLSTREGTVHKRFVKTR